MSGMSLHDNGTAGGKGGGRIASCDGEGKREIRSAKHRHRPESHIAKTKIRLGCRLPVGIGRIEPEFLECAFAYLFGK